MLRRSLTCELSLVLQFAVVSRLNNLSESSSAMGGFLTVPITYSGLR
jgi:hypothetical protein